MSLPRGASPYKEGNLVNRLAVVVVLLAVLVVVERFIPGPAQQTLEKFSPAIQEWHKSGKLMQLPYLKSAHLFVLDVPYQGDNPDPPVMVLLHGFPASCWDYHKAIPFLTKKVRVICFDHLGYGFSSKPATNFTYSIAEHADNALWLWKELKIKKAHIVAHDVGDSILTEILARRYRGFLLPYFDQFFSSVIFTNGGMRYELASLRIGQKLLSSRFGEYINAFFVKIGFLSREQLRSVWGDGRGPEVDQDIQEILDIHAYHDGHLLSYKLLYYLHDRIHFEPRWFEALKHLDIPCKFVWGDSDAVAPVAIPKSFEGFIPGLSIEWMKGVGHWLALERPSEWVELITKEL